MMLYSYIPQPTSRTNIAPVLPRSAFRAHAELMKVAIEETITARQKAATR